MSVLINVTIINIVYIKYVRDRNLKKVKVLPRFELGLLDSKSNVLPLHHRTRSTYLVSQRILKCVLEAGESKLSVNTYPIKFV